MRLTCLVNPEVSKVRQPRVRCIDSVYLLRKQYGGKQGQGVGGWVDERDGGGRQGTEQEEDG